MRPQLQSMLDHLAAQARVNLELFGHLMPCAFLVSKKTGQIEVIGCEFPDDEAKDQAVIALRKRAGEINANTFIMLGEAWHATIESGQWDGTPAAEMPNKREVVHMYVEDDDDGYFVGIAPITRDTGHPTFGPMQWEPRGEREAFERFQKILA